MDFLVLGTLEARDLGRPLAIGAPRTRTVLALLLTPPNALVSVDRLVDELWPEQAPRAARELVHGYLSRLRRALHAGSAADRLVTRKPGYLLRVEDHELDRCRFERLLADARAHAEAGRLDQSLARYRHAGRLWRGTPFLDVPATATITAAVTSLTELRLTSLAEQYEVALQLGGGADLVAELTDLVTAYPLRERLVGQLMRALHHAGRTADALDLYHRTRQRLADELGIGPGRQLRQCQLSILREETDPVAVNGPAPPVRPAQLPADLPTFVGREPDLAYLLAGDPDPGRAGNLVVIDGMAGVGKTALAVHAAHRLAARFPDGQLFLDLHGYPEQPTPVEPAAALDQLLRALGHPGDQVPGTVPERAALYRSLLAQRRVLVLLDNAADEEQVRPLLPGTGGSLVLVTSRRRLTGLDGAGTRSLDVLPAADAARLFVRVAGPAWLADQPPDLVEQVVELCGRLPLAIRIAAARLRARPAWTLEHLVARLRAEPDRLAELATGQTGVAAAFGLSYRHLTAAQQRLFRLLGLHPGADIDRSAAAALAGTPGAATGRLLEDLVDANLLLSPQPDRYRFHDLLRAYAAGLATGEEPAAARQAALTRLLDHYTDTARAATNACYPEAGPSPPSPAVPRLAEPDAAAAWLAAERANLLAVAGYAAAADSPQHTVRLSRILYRYLDSQSHLAYAETLHTYASEVARRTGDRTGQAQALRYLATVHSRQGRAGSARRLFRQALDRYRQAGDRPGQAAALHSLGLVSRQVGRYRESLACYQQALPLYDEAGDLANVARIRHGLGTIRALLGQYDEALDELWLAQALHSRVGNRDGLARTTHGLGEVYRLRDEPDRALGHLQQAVDIHRQTGNQGCLAGALDSLGRLHRQTGRHQAAIDTLRQALALHRRLGLRPGEAEALNSLGQALLAAGRATEALAHHRQALALADQLSDRYEQARAHAGLGCAHQALGDPDRAAQLWRRALRRFTQLGVPEAAEVRRQLQALSHPARPGRSR